MDNNLQGYLIANMTSEEEALLKKVEDEIRDKTGKKFVLIAWQEEDKKLT